MALDAYVLVTPGFEGTSKKGGHPPKSSIVHSVRHQVNTPIDATHGNVTGRRVHSPIVVAMTVDTSIYQYYQKLIEKDKDGSKTLAVDIGFFRPQQANIGLFGKGETAPYYNIQLKDAYVVSINFVMPDSRAQQGSPDANRQEYVEVTFAYREIHFLFADGNKEAVDQWDK
jgi:type VI secretion system Hcp family effector